MASHVGRSGVFPVYIVHQSLIIGFALALAPLRWAATVEGPLLAALTFAASFGTYALVRRVRWLRPVFGLANPPATAVNELLRAGR